MKSILEYLQERRDMACHNLLCYSATYGMTTPKEGREKEFSEAVRDCEIVDELIAMVEATETPPRGGCPLHGHEKEIPVLLKLLHDVEDYTRANSLSNNQTCKGASADSISVEEATTMLASKAEQPIYPSLVLRRLVLDLTKLLNQKPLPVDEIAILNETIKALTPVANWEL